MTHGKLRPARVVGAYAIQPTDRGERPDFIRQVLSLPGCSGLEIPVCSVAYLEDQHWLWDALPPGGRHVVTTIGGEFDRYARDATFGLGSVEPAGRRAALDFLHQCRDEVERRFASREHTIAAVEVHSVPSVEARDARAAAECFTESLVEAATWDWCGAALVVEHCDARTIEHPWQKGLLPLALEIEAVRAAQRAVPAARIGVSINWGRSAIETRGPDGPHEHARLAREAGLLSGVMFSGASDLPSSYGAAWADVHVPLRPGAGTSEPGEPLSVMTADHVRSTLDAAGTGLIFDGVKVSIRPLDGPNCDRLALVDSVLAAMGRG
jgi:hypothetical protein